MCPSVSPTHPSPFSLTPSLSPHTSPVSSVVWGMGMPWAPHWAAELPSPCEILTLSVCPATVEMELQEVSVRPSP